MARATGWRNGSRVILCPWILEMHSSYAPYRVFDGIGPLRMERRMRVTSVTAGWRVRPRACAEVQNGAASRGVMKDWSGRRIR